MRLMRPLCCAVVLCFPVYLPAAALAQRMALPQTACLALSGRLPVPETDGGRMWYTTFEDDGELIQVSDYCCPRWLLALHCGTVAHALGCHAADVWVLGWRTSPLPLSHGATSPALREMTLQTCEPPTSQQGVYADQELPAGCALQPLASPAAYVLA